MVQSLAAYLIVVLAAAWVLWSMLLPARPRAALRRALGLKSPACGLSGGDAACGAGGCAGCPLAVLRGRVERTEPRDLPLHL